VWADERLAGEHERSLVAFWDALLDADRTDPSKKLAVLAGVEFGELIIGTPRAVDTIEHGIQRFVFGEPERSLSHADWEELLDGLNSRGLRLEQSDWHHARFSPARDGAPARSIISATLHVVDGGSDLRIIVEGEISVEWSALRDPGGNPLPERIDVSRLRMLKRRGAPAFQQILGFAWREGDRLSRLHPILLYDLDRDGRPEVVMVGAGRVLWNQGREGFRNEPLTQYPYVLAETAVIADLTGDGQPDLLAPRVRGDLVLYAGDPQGRFSTRPRVFAGFDGPLQGPAALSVGDVDGDDDLDVWLAQYKPAYVGGQMPSPYYDANDGHPAYLLLNDGSGGLSDATEAAGLAPKRLRRTYASSLVDLDGDRDLDLLVVSDFAGVDLYHNDGTGHFSDANHTLRADRHLFGMSASFADYDLDGQLDFFVAGMASTTARRLEAMGLQRGEGDEEREMRMRMAFGNRMYLASDAGWREPEFSAQVARTGWTWGTTSLDFDNDGAPDLFAANGHESGESTADYCTNFWTHDIFDASSQPDPALASLFEEVGGGLAQGEQSWDGYQKNHLLMNRAGEEFVNVAFLLGVADEFDSRSAVSADLDLDGRVDIVVVENDGGDGQKLHIYRNQLETGNHWIGVRLQERPDGASPVGASVTVRTTEREHVAQVVTGETLMGQHSTTLHFGLGDDPDVESIEVAWVDGEQSVIRDPQIDRYHEVR